MYRTDLVGQKFNRLTVIQRYATTKKEIIWECVCECGKTVKVKTARLKKGIIKSCGCYKRKHGKSKTHLHNIWWQMKQRCNNPNDSNFKNYGSRGITICPEWNDDSVAFINWAINNGGENQSLQLDRKNNNEGYSPENCRFVTCMVNQQNRRSNKLNKQKVKEIRRLYANDKLRLVDIANKFQISISTVHEVVKYKTWINVE